MTGHTKKSAADLWHNRWPANQTLDKRFPWIFHLKPVQCLHFLFTVGCFLYLTEIKAIIQGRLNEYCRAVVDEDFVALAALFTDDAKLLNPGSPDVIVGKKGGSRRGVTCPKVLLKTRGSRCSMTECLNGHMLSEIEIVAVNEHP